MYRFSQVSLQETIVPKFNFFAQIIENGSEKYKNKIYNEQKGRHKVKKQKVDTYYSKIFKLYRIDRLYRHPRNHHIQVSVCL